MKIGGFYLLNFVIILTIKQYKKLWKTGCSTNPVGEKLPTGFFICKKEKSRL